MHSAGRRFRPTTALALLGVLWLGLACHAWHHFTDPDCDESRTHPSQPCATCAAFHGGTVVSDPQTGTSGAPDVFAEVTLPETARPALVRVSSGSPRAPPAV